MISLISGKFKVNSDIMTSWVDHFKTFKSHNIGSTQYNVEDEFIYREFTSAKINIVLKKPNISDSWI